MNNPWVLLLLLGVTFVASIYLIAKGVETFMRGTRKDNPNRTNDMLFGLLLLAPGVLLGLFGYFWLYPRIT